MHIPLASLFPASKPLVGMVHLMPLPGSPGSIATMKELVDRAVADAVTLEAAGADGVVVENYGDVPFYPGAVPPETLAAITVCVREVVGAVRFPVGVNVLRNDGAGAISIAAATGARFVRINVHTGVMVTDQGLLSGQAHQTLRLRHQLHAEIAIFADVWVKHATPITAGDLEQVGADTFDRGLADTLIVTGPSTGRPADLAWVKILKKMRPDIPVLVGSGVTIESIVAVMDCADGAIVGSATAYGGKAGSGVDPTRAALLVSAARERSKGPALYK